ncbi:alkaline phosphatase family protein [Novosphingobium bradum]|uniref:Alkaline phosphatase n=1 Tax=Novosphingobium bradum TaxID=1737444 RepID=A0ABV7IRU5_9SPHN
MVRRFSAWLARAALAAALGALPACASAEPAAAPAPSAPPRLVVAIAVDQFSADLFAQYRQRFTGGLARLTQGAVFPSAFQSHAATETCPGHSTILTGDHPARTGIVANSWFDLGVARADKRIYCAEDETDPASTARDPVVSAGHLRVPTLGEWLKRADPRSRNVAVSAKDRAVMMMGGHQIDEAWWFLGGRFVTLRGRAEPRAVASANAALAKVIAAGAPALPVPAWCAPRDRAVTAGRVTVGQGRFALPAGNADALRVSPRMDAATLDLATRLVADMGLGRGPAPDLLSVSLSATDYIGHAMGNEGLEMCIQMARLDAALGSFFARLDAAGIDYAVVLTADHGGFDMPERLDQQALPAAARVDPAAMPGALGKALGAELGLAARGGPLVYGDGAGGDFYLSREIPAERRDAALAALAALAARQPQVAAVFTAAQLSAMPMPHGEPQDWTLAERARAGFDPRRSGDVVVLLRRGVVPIPMAVPGYVATHGSPWDYDRRVPLLFWRKGLAGFEQPAPVETVDIAPSLAALLGLKLPAGTFDGRCLDLDGGAGDTCR